MQHFPTLYNGIKNRIDYVPAVQQLFALAQGSVLYIVTQKLVRQLQLLQQTSVDYIEALSALMEIEQLQQEISVFGCTFSFERVPLMCVASKPR